MALKRDLSQSKPDKKLSTPRLASKSQSRVQTEESNPLYNPGSRKSSLAPKLDEKPSLMPTLVSPRKPPSKFSLNAMLKPQSIDLKNIVPPLISPHAESGTIMSAKNRADYANFMLKLYKTPSENSKVFTKSFVSFRELTSIQASNTGVFNTEEVFLPSHTDSWKAQLEFNKKQEGMFKQTIHDVFRESQSNFNKLVKDKQKRNNTMPHVRIYHHAQELKNEQTKDAPSEPEQQENNTTSRNYQQPGSKLLEYASRIRLGKGESYKFYEYPPADSTARMPCAREGATLTVVGNSIYLYGGISRELHNEVEVLNTFSFTWEKVEQKGDVPQFGRLGHSADNYQNSFLIFGGEKSYNSTLNIRDCLSDVRLFMPETSEWKYIKCYGEHIEPRRNHTGTVVGKHLVVYGGIDSNGGYLNDLKILDLVTNRWGSVEETNKDIRGIAFHRACLVLLPQRKEVNLFKLPDLKIDENGPTVAEEGIYFFGGKNDLEESSNTLRVLKIGALPFKWVTPKTEGSPPDPRFSHTMVHCKKLNMLVVHGGRFDDLYSQETSPYLGDFFMLQLDNLTWYSIILKGAQPSPRCSHAAAVVGTKMLIFGGIYFGIYCPPESKVIQMDPLQVHKLDTKRESNRRSVDFANIPPKMDQIMMNNNNINAINYDSMNQIKNYDGVVSFLPVPKLNKRRKLKSVSKPLFK